MAVHELDEIIARHAFFRDLRPEHLKFLKGCAKTVRFAAHEMIFKQGDTADDFYIVRKGLVRIELSSLASGPRSLQTVGPEDVLGWSWLVPPHKWAFDARAMEDTLAVSFDAKCLRGKFETDHELGYQFLKRFVGVMARRLSAARLQLLDFYALES